MSDTKDTIVVQASTSTGSARSPKESADAAQLPPPPAPKTDKPRPHVCATCARSFARLEHLKRHERSHTKEKPFECPECSRCFARRDLLLRHQQKLHMTTTPSSRPRNGGRRDSTSAVTTTGRVRKNSVSTAATTNAPSSSTTTTMRPRANTLSHIDSSTLEMLAQVNGGGGGGGGHTNSRGGIASITAPMGHGRLGTVMPKLNTVGLGMDLHGPVSAGPTLPELHPGEYFFGTINPAALHYSYSPQQQPLHTPTSPYGPYALDSHYSIDECDDDGFGWMGGLEHLDDQGSPSAISTTSQSALSEALLNDPSIWNNALNLGAAAMNFNDYTHNYNDTPPPTGTVSPRSLMAQNGETHFFTTPPPMGTISPSSQSQTTNYNHYSGYMSEQSQSSATSLGSNHMGGSVSAESITDATRAALLATLTGSSTFGATQYPSQHRRRYSTSTISPSQTPFLSAASLPGTQDLQRYVASYIKNFHPHLPFLHLPTLNFDSPIYTNIYKNSNGHRSGINGGGGCLILSIAAIGALYEHEIIIAKDLFDAAKKTVHIFLEDRRKADVTAAMNGINNTGANSSDSSHNTPVWLVQAMLLNIIFGLHCGDKLACDIAMNHCAALVSLARAAGLTSPAQSVHNHFENDVHMGDFTNDGWAGVPIKVEYDSEREWLAWAAAEERKRTLYAVHLLSSLLVAAHNMQPSLMNNEIRLDLPCDEDLWVAENSAVWQARGGAAAAAASCVNFANALHHLLSASQYNNPNGKLGMQFSAFGCLVLICALHVYIWESRQRQHTRSWTAAEAESMHNKIEPALQAWSRAWVETNEACTDNNTMHHQPLSNDSIPLLDLAYIRLFVDMGRSKEAFWARDFDLMAEELANGWEYNNNSNSNSNSNGNSNSNSNNNNTSNSPRNPILNNSSSSTASSVSGRSVSPLTEISPASSPASITSSPNLHAMKLPQSAPTHTSGLIHPTKPSNREKHLRRAVEFAADALTHSETYMGGEDGKSPDYPIQAYLCTFDCAQVLAEWIATVQERVGPYMGLIGSEQCNLDSIEASMLLESEDRRILSRVMQLVQTVEMRLSMEFNLQQRSLNISNEGGLGPRVLRSHAYLLERSVVWPVTRLMAQALRAQADHMENRVKKGLHYPAF